MTAHFYDINTLIDVNNNVWIISKNNPSIPIIKIPKSEFNTIKKGVYKKYESSLMMDGIKYWLDKDLYNNIKIKCKKAKCDITSLAFSLQEFMNDDIIKHLDYNIKGEHYKHLKNKTDDIYVICSEKNKQSYDPIIKKLEEKLEEEGLVVKKYYFISETFYNRNKDDISYKKVRLLLQHLVGYKTDGDKFTNEELDSYTKIYFYDDNPKTIKLSLDINSVFKTLTDNTDDDIKDDIKEIIKSNDKIIVINQVTNNKLRLFSIKEIQIKWDNIIKTFEFFKFK